MSSEMTYLQWIYCGTILLSFVVQANTQCDDITAAYGDQGSIKVPDDGSATYPVNLDKCWKISSEQAGMPLMIGVSLELGDDDSLTLINGANPASDPVMGFFEDVSGRVAVYAVSSGTCTVKLTTDAYKHARDKSIEVQYLFVNETACHTAVPNATPTPQFVASPNFPSKYNTGETCLWNITASVATSTIEVKLLFKHIEQSGACTNKDYLQIIDTANNNKSDAICGNSWEQNFVFNSSEDQVQIKFVSDAFSAKHGFVVQYREIRTTPNVRSCL